MTLTKLLLNINNGTCCSMHGNKAFYGKNLPYMKNSDLRRQKYRCCH